MNDSKTITDLHRARFDPHRSQPLLNVSTMAGGKKKKKPATNPARGFATTSIASKPRSELPDLELEPKLHVESVDKSEDGGKVSTEKTIKSTGPIESEQSMTAEQFEKHLEESELQLIVEKHAQKAKRDSLRQKTRLETDRRVLRGQAENLSTRRWLPTELMEEILDLMKLEGKFSGSSTDAPHISRDLSEEDLIIRLWTLQQALVDSGFLEDHVASALRHVLDISDRVYSGSKDAIWGLDEALDWFARNCSREELPDYEGWQRKSYLPKSQNGQFPTLWCSHG